MSTTLPALPKVSPQSRISVTAAALTGQYQFSPDVPDWPTYLLNYPFIPQENLHDHAEAFRKIEIVATCVDALASDVAALPIKVYKGHGKARIEQEPQVDATGRPINLAGLLAHPRPQYPGYSLRYDSIARFVTIGNTYWQFISMAGDPGPVSEIHCLPADRYQVVPIEHRGVIAYRYWKGGAWQDARPEAVMHVPDYNPDDEPIGVSRLESARSLYEAQWYALIWLRDFFRRGGQLSGVYSVDMSAKNQHGRPITPDDITEMQRRLVERHLGIDKAWFPTLLQGLQHVATGMKLSEMELKKNLDITNDGIRRRVGVAASRIGLKIEGQTANANESEEAAENYWMGTVLSITSRFDGHINSSLARRYGSDIWVHTDLSRTLAMQKARLEQAKAGVIKAGRPTHSVNEVRDEMGDPEFANADGTPDETANELFLPQNIDVGTVQRGPAMPDTEVPNTEKKPQAPTVGDTPTGTKKQDGAKLSRFARCPVGSPERETLRRHQDMNLARYERKVARVVAAHFSQQRDAVLKRLRAQHPTGVFARRELIAVHIEDLIPTADESVQRRFEELVRELVRDRGEEALADLSTLTALAERAAFDVDAARAAEFIANKSRVFALLDQTTTNELRDKLAAAVAPGTSDAPLQTPPSLSELVALVQGVYDGRISDAQNIARTETASAYNFAAKEAFIQSGVQGLRMGWLTARDGQGNRHAVPALYPNLDGQVRDLDQDFDLNGVPSPFPGGSGDPSEDNCCRCVLIPEFDDVPDEPQYARVSLAELWKRNGHSPKNRIKELVK